MASSSSYTTPSLADFVKDCLPHVKVLAPKVPEGSNGQVVICSIVGEKGKRFMLGVDEPVRTPFGLRWGMSGPSNRAQMELSIESETEQALISTIVTHVKDQLKANAEEWGINSDPGLIDAYFQSPLAAGKKGYAPLLKTKAAMKVNEGTAARMRSKGKNPDSMLTSFTRRMEVGDKIFDAGLEIGEEALADPHTLIGPHSLCTSKLELNFIAITQGGRNISMSLLNDSVAATKPKRRVYSLPVKEGKTQATISLEEMKAMIAAAESGTSSPQKRRRTADSTTLEVPVTAAVDGGFEGWS